jgi:hypothetical protein
MNLWNKAQHEGKNKDRNKERIPTCTRYCNNVYQSQSEMFTAEVLASCMLK